MKYQLKHIYKLIVCLMTVGLLLFARVDMNTVYAKKISLNKSKLTLSKGSTYKLKLKNTAGKAKWSSNNKKIATVTSKGVVKAKKKGTAIITAKLSGRKYKCKVTVKNNSLAATKQEKEVFELINEQREKRGLKPLEMDAKLQKAAKKRAKELVKNYSHTRPDGKDALSILSDCNINYSSAGENIAAGYPTSKDVVNAWMSSEGHKENILYQRFNKIGVGYCKSSNSTYQYYWVQLFTN